VSADTVLRLARSGMRPRAVPVAAGTASPPGLRLSGVSGLGLGARDGDLLTHVQGRPVLSYGQVVAAIVDAISRQARTVSGRLWRGGRTIDVIVELPYEKS
jgi:hypothetical protein